MIKALEGFKFDGMGCFAAGGSRVILARNHELKPADKNHHFGHSKAEYFSSAIEGVMIFVAFNALDTSPEGFIKALITL